jgi:hypothetical protein
MRKIIVLAIAILTFFVLTGCSGSTNATKDMQKSNGQTTTEKQGGDVMMKETKIKITVGDNVLYANLEDNAATRALIKKLPMTLPMQNLYSREMCYRYGQGGLPTDKLRSDHYEVGDIAYWPPRGSLVILYKQNGEEFERQQIGHIDQGVEIFENAGNKQVMFELAE